MVPLTPPFAVGTEAKTTRATDISGRKRERSGLDQALAAVEPATPWWYRSWIG